MIIIEDILTNDLDIIPKYTKITVIENLSKKEPYLLKSLSDYSKRVIKDRWSEAEPIIMKNPQSAEQYTKFVNSLNK